MALKILSDFDGVWTNQAEEASEVLSLMISRVAALAGVERAQVEADFERFEALVLGQPEQHGWAPDGRITAYVDEDPFCVPNALATWLGKDEARALPETAVYREAILASGLGLSDFGEIKRHHFFDGAGFRNLPKGSVVKHSSLRVACQHWSPRLGLHHWC